MALFLFIIIGWIFFPKKTNALLGAFWEKTLGRFFWKDIFTNKKED